MERVSRWETEALRSQRGRPRPGSTTIDLRDSSSADSSPEPPSEAPPGTLLVPLDAWQRMLDQLGNLHQAGQQLADASARAARAETEAEFLKERVADLRRQLAEAHASTDAGSPDQAPEPPPGPVSAAATRARTLYDRLRRNRRRTP